jgi:IS1 family transposase
MRLAVRVGNYCERILDERLRGLKVNYCQCDEIWCYVAKKQRRMVAGDSPEFGDTYTYVGFDQDTKLAIGYRVGKRSDVDTSAFMMDLAERIDGFVQITTDGWTAYPGAIMDSFNGRSKYAQIIKTYGGGTTDASHRYSPARISSALRIGMWGHPRMRYASTSHVERQNLTMRMQMRRFTRLTNAFSKKLANLKAAVALHFAWYNFVRPHRSLGGNHACNGGGYRF